MKNMYDIRMVCKAVKLHHSVYYYHKQNKENSYHKANEELDIDSHFNLSNNPQIKFSYKNSLFQNNLSNSQFIFLIFSK